MYLSIFLAYFNEGLWNDSDFKSLDLIPPQCDQGSSLQGHIPGGLINK